ncbi:MAG: hypothetical protein ACQESR_04925 [Planctomycetota bacterium]
MSREVRPDRSHKHARLRNLAYRAGTGVLKLLAVVRSTSTGWPSFSKLMAGLFIAAGLGLVFTLTVVTAPTALALTAENGPIENMTAAAFALSALFCAIGAYRVAAPQRYYCLAWAILCFVFLGEEISWGQHWFHYPTPEFLSSNSQGEANFHNLPCVTPRVVDGPCDLITSQGAFYAGFGLYFLAFPAATLGSRRARRWAQRLAFPTIPIAMLTAIWIPIGVSFLLAILTEFGPRRESLTETREFLCAASILAYTLLLARSGHQADSLAMKTAE